MAHSFEVGHFACAKAVSIRKSDGLTVCEDSATWRLQRICTMNLQIGVLQYFARYEVISQFGMAQEAHQNPTSKNRRLNVSLLLRYSPPDGSRVSLPCLPIFTRLPDSRTGIKDLPDVVLPGSCGVGCTKTI